MIRNKHFGLYNIRIEVEAETKVC